MLIDPDLDEIVMGDRGIFKGIDACINTRCLVSAVALIYSSIDTLSALTRPLKAQRTDRHIFTKWVEKYMRPEETLKCSAYDLYGARCGVLHTYRTHSELSRSGDAKHLIYKWKDGPDPDPNRARPLPADAIYLCVEELRSVLEGAVGSFGNDIGGNADLKAKVDQHCKELLCYKPWSVVAIVAA